MALPDSILAYVRAVGLGVVEVLNTDERAKAKFEKLAKGKIKKVGKQYQVQPEDLEIVGAILQKVYANVVMAKDAIRASKAAAPDASPYVVLGVAPEADNEVVLAAYRALVLKLHPDRGGDANRMARVNAAMDLIKKERGL